MRADSSYCQFIIGLVQEVPVDIAKSQDKQLLDQHYFYVVDLSFQFLQVFFFDLGAHALVLLCQLLEHFLEETVLYELYLVASAEDKLGVLPLVQAFEGLFGDMLEAVSEEDQVILQCLLVDRHLREFIQH